MSNEKICMKPKQIPELTGLRGLAALFIIVNHLVLVLPCIRDTALCYYTTQCGLAGMSLFFILSGIVIYYNYAEKIRISPVAEIKAFFVARFARLYPLYIVFILGFFVWNVFRHPELLPRHISSLPIFLTGMQSWLYGYIDGMEILYHQEEANISWSISTEFALYFAFVPLVLLMRKSGWKAGLAVVALAFIGRLCFLYVVYGLQWPTAWMDSLFPGHPDAAWAYLVYHSPVGRLFEFVFGCGVAMIYRHVQENGVSRVSKALSLLSWVASLVLLVMVCCKCFSFPIWDHTVVTPIFMLFCLGLPCLGAKFLRGKVLNFLGEVSYSAYLLHIVFVILLHYDGRNWHSIVGTLAGFLVFTYLLAYLSWRYLETPARRLVRNLFRNGKGSAR